MGVVSRAREVARGRIVALKRMLRGPESTSQDIERFRVEAQAASRLAHPHIVPVFQVGECEDQPYFTMQYVEGTTLARKLADGPMPAARRGPAAGPGLPGDPLRPRVRRPAPRPEAVQHPDRPRGPSVRQRLRPGQADRRRPVAHPLRSLAGDAAATWLRSRPGRPSAGARPRGSGERRLQPGAILYHMLTGRPPFQAATPIETILLALEHDPIPPRALNPRVSPDLEMIALQVPPEVARAALPVGRGPGRRPRGLPPRRSGLGPLDEPPGAGRPAAGRDAPRPGRSRTGACSGSTTASPCSSSSARPTGSRSRA